MAFFGSARRVGRRTARRTSRRWGQMSQGAGSEEAEQAPQQAQPQPSEDPVKLLQTRLAKGEITPEQYQASLKALQGT
jgi:hypothetical protein